MDESQLPQMNDLTFESADASTPQPVAQAADLSAKLRTGPEKTQLEALSALANLGEAGVVSLQDFLLERQQANQVSFLEGRAYELVCKLKGADAEFLQTHFPQGVVPLRSQVGIDYLPLQRLLAQQDFQAADELTLQKLCELAGPAAVRRKWLYFTEVDQFPVTDLQTINQLWLVHSLGKFGFSVQRKIWVSGGQNWDLFWRKIGWKLDKKWTRYPGEFTWSLDAPRGHLPLSNQLRGVQVINALLNHSAWTS